MKPKGGIFTCGWGLIPTGMFRPGRNSGSNRLPSGDCEQGRLHVLPRCRRSFSSVPGIGGGVQIRLLAGDGPQHCTWLDLAIRAKYGAGFNHRQGPEHKNFRVWQACERPTQVCLYSYNKAYHNKTSYNK